MVSGAAFDLGGRVGVSGVLMVGFGSVVIPVAGVIFSLLVLLWNVMFALLFVEAWGHMFYRMGFTPWFGPELVIGVLACRRRSYCRFDLVATLVCVCGVF